MLEDKDRDEVVASELRAERERQFVQMYGRERGLSLGIMNGCFILNCLWGMQNSYEPVQVQCSLVMEVLIIGSFACDFRFLSLVEPWLNFTFDWMKN